MHFPEICKAIESYESLFSQKQILFFAFDREFKYDEEQENRWVSIFFGIGFDKYDGWAMRRKLDWEKPIPIGLPDRSSGLMR